MRPTGRPLTALGLAGWTVLLGGFLLACIGLGAMIGATGIFQTGAGRTILLEVRLPRVLMAAILGHFDAY